MPCEVNSCCGCVELRTGCFIIGYVNLVWTIIVAIIGLVALIGSASVVLVIDFALVLLNLVFIAFLLVGLHQHKPRAVHAYLMFGIIFVAFSLVMFIINLAFGFAILSIIINLIDLCLTIYFLIVIRSYYLLMDNGASAAARY